MLPMRSYLEVTMNIEIEASEAATRFLELLRSVQAGRRYTITSQGEALADLVLSEKARKSNTVAAVEDNLPPK